MADSMKQFKLHAMQKVHFTQSLPESEWMEFNRPDNVNIAYRTAAEELVRDGYLAHGDNYGYKPGPKFEEGLKEYGITGHSRKLPI